MLEMDNKKLQKIVNRYRTEKLEAQARVYDLTYYGETKPTDIELKARIIYLEKELSQAIAKRDYWKGKWMMCKAENKMEDK